MDNKEISSSYFSNPRNVRKGKQGFYETDVEMAKRIFLDACNLTRADERAKVIDEIISFACNPDGTVKYNASSTILHHINTKMKLNSLKQ